MNNENEVMEKAPVLTKKDCVKGAIRWSLMAVTTFNYDTQLAPAVVFGIGPLLRKIYKDDDEYVEALNNHYKYFNTMPWLANIVLGATLALEDKEGISSLDAVQNIKVSLMGPLAGIGDTLFWTLLPTIMGSIAGYMALEGNPIGVILWLIVNLIFICIRTQLMWIGYREGTKLITNVGGKLARITDAASVLGLTVVGALSATVVTALIIGIGNIIVSLGFGVLSGVKLPWIDATGISHLGLYDWLDTFTGYILLPLGCWLVCVFVAKIWGFKNYEKELTNDGKYGKLSLYDKILTIVVVHAFMVIVILNVFGFIQ